MSEYERCKQEVAEAETSCSTRQTTIFRFIDLNQYSFNEVEDMIDGERTMIHFPSDEVDTKQSSIIGWV
jgi:hypothetical protein